MVISLDDTLSLPDTVTSMHTSYFDTTGNKIGGDTKPFTKEDFNEIPEGTKKAIIVDVGIWSGKSMLPLIERFKQAGITVTIIAGFSKKEARERFSEQGVQMETLLPFSDYDDWAELRDLLTLFIKSGFFMGKQSRKDTDRFLPYGVFLGKELTYYTQPSVNLPTYYEKFESNNKDLSQALLQLSYAFWKEMENVNSSLSLNKLRSLFPTRFGLPYVETDPKRPLRFSPNEKPSDTIAKLYDII